MITKDEFKGLFNFLNCNNWKVMSHAELGEQEFVYYEKLKNYDYTHLKTAFSNIFDSDQQFPSIQRIKNELSSILQLARKQVKPIPNQKIINKLFRRLIKQSEYIIAKYGNNKQKLADCGIFYDNLRRKIRGEKVIDYTYYKGKTYYYGKGKERVSAKP